MPKGNKPAARAIEWLCLIIGASQAEIFKSMPGISLPNLVTVGRNFD
jgi:hypothetical protein